MFSYIGYILNLITFGFSTLTCLITLIILGLIIRHLYYNRLQREDKIVLIISITTYLLILFCAIIILSFSIQTLLGDLHEKNFDSSWCVCAGYLYITFGGALFWNFFNQAVYRLCRIVYPTYQFLQYPSVYIILPITEFILTGIFLCPLLVWQDIAYLPNEYYCFSQFTRIGPTVWLTLVDYGISVTLLSLIYLCIIIFLRQQSQIPTLVVRRHQQERDVVVIQRIIMIVAILVVFATPSLVLILMLYITGKLHPLYFRITWPWVSLSMIVLCLTVLFFTPQLKQIVMKKFRRNQIIPTGGPGTNRNP